MYGCEFCYRDVEFFFPLTFWFIPANEPAPLRTQHSTTPSSTAGQP